MNTIDVISNKKKNLELLIQKIGLSNTITNFQYALDSISTNVFTNIKIDSYIKNRLMTCPGINSSMDTLHGIYELCKIGDYPDVYLLIRKLRDNLFLDLFLFEAQKNLTNTEGNSMQGIDLNDIDKILESVYSSLSFYKNREQSKEEFSAINKWKNDELLSSKDDKIKKKYFGFYVFKSYLKENNPDLKECFDIFLDKRFNELTIKLNDYVHANSESMLSRRQNHVYLLEDIKNTILEVEQLFIISLFLIDSTMLSAEDYDDFLQMGETPLEGSQYIVNGFIQEVFLQIKEDDKVLFQFLLDHNKYSMNINL